MKKEKKKHVMEEKKNKKLPIIIGLSAVLVVAVVLVLVLVLGGHRVIKVQSFSGQVTLERGSNDKDMVEGMNLKSEDKVTTGDDGLVELLVDEDKHILAKENTCFKIEAKGNENKGKLKIKLEYGTSLVEIDNKLADGSSVEVETPNATLSVRGTTFETTYKEGDDTTVVKVTDGAVKIKSDKEEKEIQAGQMATIKADVIEVQPLLNISFSDQVAFEARYSETYENSGINVMQLNGWEYIPVEDRKSDQPDVFAHASGVKVRYWVLSESRVNEWIDDNAGMGWTTSIDYLKNNDGDTIICEELHFNGDIGEDILFAYQYYKETYDGVYVSVMVYDEMKGESLTDTEIESFLDLTSDEGFGY